MIKDKYADKIIEILNNRGFEAYYVGGCVRDSLLGITPSDYDITTNARPDEVVSLFKALNHNVIETGLKHGTVSVAFEKRLYEVTTFRTDGKYTDGRHPESVVFVQSLKEDLARRDFTVNAMAYHHKTGLVDCFGGRNDLDSKKIRCVGNPVKRFEEDALRILRALRFAGRYDFLIEDETSRAIKDCKELLRNISSERIYSELCGILLTSSAAKILREYVDVFGVFMPEILNMANFEHTLAAIENSPKDLIVRLTLLFNDFKDHPYESCKISQNILRRLKADNKTRERVERLVLHHDDRIPFEEASILRFMRRMGEDCFRAIEVEQAGLSAQNLQAVQKRFEELLKIKKTIEDISASQDACISLGDLQIKGSDVISCGIKPGPTVGRVLNAVLEEVIEKRLPNEREALVNFVKQML